MGMHIEHCKVEVGIHVQVKRDWRSLLAIVC